MIIPASVRNKGVCFDKAYHDFVIYAKFMFSLPTLNILKVLFVAKELFEVASFHSFQENLVKIVISKPFEKAYAASVSPKGYK